ncbi:2-succinyl-6-hydroxy-2, 4-cyclohexadiene-1-carboxylate synthase [Paenibacillus plantiphilus]|uniref:2-succinyl-6-hydroxy-2, 4-cyclohexadiene-1-carboxylate synthase n=1 Tax=Paenibacillus plantiphilus TaxID=2905650 RepID=A0ABM9CR08_9BACL|nr:alpha/beta hydrolase [Paenibacillus plantiphilus]CAH1221811.1 2-succinyl-6-hydroxy-2, 4-cyclohexadiene-1-carboxylate synthase [Paenibacillus plantiphilus]
MEEGIGKRDIVEISDSDRRLNRMETSEAVGFVMLHGAGLGAWIWQDTVSRMEHPVLAIDLPGRGKHANTLTKELTFQQYVEAVLAEVDSFNPRKLILVCHSISGLIGLEIASLRKDRIVGFIAVGAAIPSGNGSFLSCIPGMQRAFLSVMLAVAGTKPPASAIRSGLCSDLDDHLAARVVERFVPESRKIYTEKLTRRGTPHNALYVLLKQDRQFQPSLQKRMAENLQASETAELDSGHLPMLSKPEELAQICKQYAESIGGGVQRA